MNLSLPPDVQKLIDERVLLGSYDSPEAVVSAALRTLEHHERWGEFAPGELDDLLAEGERSIAAEGLLDGEEAYRLRREQRAKGR